MGGGGCAEVTLVTLEVVLRGVVIVEDVAIELRRVDGEAAPLNTAQDAAARPHPVLLLHMSLQSRQTAAILLTDRTGGAACCLQDGLPLVHDGVGLQVDIQFTIFLKLSRHFFSRTKFVVGWWRVCLWTPYQFTMLTFST